MRKLPKKLFKYEWQSLNYATEKLLSGDVGIVRLDASDFDSVPGNIISGLYCQRVFGNIKGESKLIWKEDRRVEEGRVVERNLVIDMAGAFKVMLDEIHRLNEELRLYKLDEIMRGLP